MQHSDSEQILSRLGRIIRRRKLLMILSFVIIVGPIGIYNEITTPIYQASTTVVFDEVSAPVQSFEFDFSREIVTANRLEEFTSFSFAKDIADALDVETLQRFPYPEEAPEGFDPLGFVVTTVQESITAYSVRASNVVRINVQMQDPELCAAIANTAAQVFQERSYRIKHEGTSGVRRFIESQLEIFSGKLKGSEQALKNYKQAHGVVSFENEAQEVLRRATEAEVLYNQAATNRHSVEERLRSVETEITKQKAGLVPAITEVSNPWAQTLMTRLGDLQTRYMDLKVENYPPTHPKMVAIQDEIDRTKKDLKAEANKLVEARNVADPIGQIEKYFKDAAGMQIEIESLKAQESALKKVINEYDRVLGDLPDKELNLAQLERDRNVSQKIYTNLLEKLEETKITEAEKIPSIRILDEARVPEGPILPRKAFNLALGVLISLVVGLGAAWILDSLTGASPGSVRDLENLTGWSVLASVPRIEKLPRGQLKLENEVRSRAQIRRIKRHVFSQIEPYSGVAEAYRMLRTNLQFMGVGERYRTILVTSIAASEGKSTTLSNLAITLAKQGQKVLVLDSEVRRPVQHTAFDVRRGPGLSEVLLSDGQISGAGEDEGHDEWIIKDKKAKKPSSAIDRLREPNTKHLEELLQDSIKPVRIKNLSILPSGDAWNNPSITISNFAQRVKVILQHLKQKYDVILIDAPPIMLVHDAAIVSALVDCVLFVVNSARIDEESLLKAKQLLVNGNANVLGIVLNHFEPVGVYGSYYSYYRELDRTEAETAQA
ncbi:MAG TPA: GNVR domain-containing protein [Candidatus Krumholzibacteria bacterium]|nr:GNVR domain-containing protein [Candidatus Krumholzibacteria bacterium]